MTAQRTRRGASLLGRLKEKWALFNRLAHLSVRRDWIAAKAASPNPLLRCGEKYFSQFDEDGIVLEILRRLELHTGRFLEIGVGDGLENNTLILLAHGWSGLWIGAEPLAWQPSGKRLTFRHAVVTRENVTELAGDAACDVFSLDIDGNDYWVAEALLGRMAPSLIVVEYNAKCPPPIRFVMPYDPRHRWDGATDYYGASLAAWADLLGTHGYYPVCCSSQGTNAFFVRIEKQDRFADVPRDLALIYQPAQYFAPFENGHRTSARTVMEMERQ